MNPQEPDSFRRRLLALREEVLAMAEADRESRRPVELGIGRLSRMDALQTQQMAQETARRRQQQLQRIEVALRRLDSGDFGYCARCGEEIDRRRLDIDPATTRCIDCVN
jgi:DnaK suppressor protein